MRRHICRLKQTRKGLKPEGRDIRLGSRKPGPSGVRPDTGVFGYGFGYLHPEIAILDIYGYIYGYEFQHRHH